MAYYFDIAVSDSTRLREIQLICERVKEFSKAPTTWANTSSNSIRITCDGYMPSSRELDKLFKSLLSEFKCVSMIGATFNRKSEAQEG